MDGARPRRYGGAEYVKSYERYGCWQVWYGIESGNDEILKLIKKNTTKEQIKRP